MTFIKIFLITAGLLILVFGLGLFWVKEEREESGPEILIKGMITALAVFEIAALGATALDISYHSLVFLYKGILILSATGSFYVRRHRVKIWGKRILKNLSEKRFWNKWKSYAWCLPALLLICFQVYVGVSATHIDDDDAFYVATASTTIETDSLFQYSSYTGERMEEKPARYVLSPFPVFMAMLSEIYRMPPAVFAHTCMPLLMIPLAYIVYGLFGRFLFGKNRKKRGIFLWLIAWMNLFGYYSIYTASTFLLIRIWQGKALLAAVFVPLLLFYLIQWYIEEKKQKGIWYLSVVSLALALCSSMGIFFAPLMIGVTGLLKCVKERKIKILFYTIILCIPCGILGILYLFIK
ncbi:MAG: DUF6077 domain-containing protein [Blautia sp.]